MGALLQAMGSAEMQAGWSGLLLAAVAAATMVLTALGAYAVTFLRSKQQLVEKETELRKLELEAVHREKLRRAAADAAAIADETSRAQTEPLSGAVKASIAAEKLVELEPAARDLEGSRLTDMVKLGVSQLRSTSYLITPSMAPPAEVVNVPAPAEPPTLPPAPRARDLARTKGPTT